MNFTSLFKDSLKLQHPNALSAEKNVQETFLRLLACTTDQLKDCYFKILEVGHQRNQKGVGGHLNSQLQPLQEAS